MEVLDRGSLIQAFKRSTSDAAVSFTPTPTFTPDQVRRQKQAWQSVIDDKLIAWGLSPEQFDDEGIEPPSREVVSLAANVAARFRDMDYVAPDSVRPDANGGIVFEKRGNKNSVVIRVWDDLTVEIQLFVGSKLIERLPLDVNLE